jgi:hypothetical protein
MGKFFIKKAFSPLLSAIKNFIKLYPYKLSEGDYIKPQEGCQTVSIDLTGNKGLKLRDL